VAVYRRGKVWWYNFEFQGRHIQKSTGFTNKTAALRVEAKHKADLAIFRVLSELLFSGRFEIFDHLSRDLIIDWFPASP
jgi:hypothetical protein